MSDELEKAKANERHRAWRLWMAAGLGGLGVAALPCAVLLWNAGWPACEPLAVMLATVGIGAVAASFAWGGRHMPNGDTIRVENAKGGYRDMIQKQRAVSMALMPVTSLYLVFRGTLGAWNIASGQGDQADWSMAALSPMIPVVLLLMVAGLDNPGDKKMKRLLEDELTLSFRRDALNVALAVVMVGLLGVFALGLWRPEAAVAALPGLMFVTASASALRYWQLDRRASGG
jgi:succinate dehydrogenase hydrophobic anchor subunit